MSDKKAVEETDYVECKPEDFMGVSHAYENAGNETDVPRYADEEERKKFEAATYMESEIVGGEGYKPHGEHDENPENKSEHSLDKTPVSEPEPAPEPPEPSRPSVVTPPKK